MVMLNYLTCMKCFEVQGIPSFEFVSLDLNDKGTYTLECSKNHKTQISLQNQKFEILFEVGVMAMLDGYHFEAIASFSAALERFFEFFIKISFCDNDEQLSDFETLWGHVESQSERQYGAFLFLYFKEFKEIEHIPNKRKEFRNKVIHKGYIPNPKETFEYGEFVFDFIAKLSRKIKKEKPEQLQKIIGLELSKKAVAEIPNTTMYISTILTLAEQEMASGSFQSKTEDLRKNRLKFWNKQ